MESDGSTYRTGVTTNLSITPSTTTSIATGRRDYPVVPDRLICIDGIDYVRCSLHGLIPLDHECAKSPLDHWCRVAAHPNHDSEDGDQGVSHDEWGSIQAMKVANWRRTAEEAAEALRLADEYLDGFVWLSDPEFSELRDIKRASKAAQKRVSFLTEHNGLTTKQIERVNPA